MSAAKSSTEVLQEAFPGRAALSPHEIAQALFGKEKATKKRAESVRRALDEGRLVPGIRKSGPRWLVPIAALGAALDEQRPTQVTPSQDPVRMPRRSKHSTIGPRMLLQTQRSHEVFAAILQEMLTVIAQDQQTHLDAVLAPGMAPPSKNDSRF